MPTVNLYTMTKRVNSTKRPTSANITRGFVYKSESSLHEPVIELHDVTSPNNYNYAKIGTDYYWITDVETLTNNNIRLTLSLDELATFKDNILSSDAYVAYASTGYDRNKTDDRVTSTGNKIFNTTEYDMPSYFSRTGCYVLTVQNNKAGGATGSVCCYAMKQTELSRLSRVMMADGFFDALWIDLKDTVVNPMDFIVECRWLPLDYATAFGGSEETVYLGYKDMREDSTSVVGKRIYGTPEHDLTTTLTITHREEEASFLDLEPFTTGFLSLPFIGVVPLDLNAFYPTTSYRIIIDLDKITGDIIYSIVKPTGDDSLYSILATYSGNCSTSIPLTRQTADAFGTGAGLLTVIGGTVAAVAGFRAGIASGIGSAFSKAGVGTAAAVGGAMTAAKGTELHSQIIGTLSSRVGSNINLMKIAQTIVQSEVTEDVFSDDRIAHMGGPVFEYRALEDMSGYIQTSGASIAAHAPLAEIEAVNSMMDSGIYIE